MALYRSESSWQYLKKVPGNESGTWDAERSFRGSDNGCPLTDVKDRRFLFVCYRKPMFLEEGIDLSTGNLRIMSK